MNFERLEENPMDAPDSGHIGSPGRDSNDEAWILILAAVLGGAPFPHDSFVFSLGSRSRYVEKS